MSNAILLFHSDPPPLKIPTILPGLEITCVPPFVGMFFENFFGMFKQEMYYGEKLLPYQELKQKVEEYINSYNNARIKTKLADVRPIQYRTQTSQTAAS